jgi:hypothetical protein
MDRLKAPLASEPTKSIALARLFVRAPIGAPHGMAIAADRRSPTTGIRRWQCEKREIETSKSQSPQNFASIDCRRPLV